MRIIIGCDPGLDGGLAAIASDGLETLVMPVIPVGKKRQIDEDVLTSWLRRQAVARALVLIEDVHARPGQGVVSMFTFGTGWGLVRGICRGLGLSYELVRPQEWQRALLIGQPVGSEYAVASRLWPGAEWRHSDRSEKPHSGLVDAALIAEYGRRRAG
ncbi:MAG: Holliday junction endonuclease [Planctomycetes bacterium]|nr:Holliday junction endonuclease [Planctomycetota bacterium]